MSSRIECNAEIRAIIYDHRVIPRASNLPLKGEIYRHTYKQFIRINAESVHIFMSEYI